MRYFIILAITLLLTSCVHKSPFDDEYYFQAMGGESDFVVSMDVDKIKKEDPTLIGVNDPLITELIEKSNRLSVSLTSEENPMKDIEFSGALEGDFSKFVINTGLAWSKEFDKVKEEEVYYTNGDISARVVENGLLMFSSDDYVKHYNTTYENRVIHISDDIASTIASNVMGLYVKDPKTMFDLGFEFPLAVLLKIDYAVMYLCLNEGVYTMNTDIYMKQTSDSNTLLSLIRNKVLSDLKSQGIRPDIKTLAKQYKKDANIVQLRDIELKDEQVKMFTSTINSLT